MKTSPIYLLVFFVSILASCTHQTEEEQNKTAQTIPVENKEPIKEIADTDSLEIYSNMEQVDYCLLLPLKEYTEDYKRNDVRAKHVFKHKTRKKDEIIVQGLFRSDVSVSLEKYFANTYPDSTDKTRMIYKKELLKDKNCFYARGYVTKGDLSQCYIEITWLRKDDVINFYTSFHTSETLVWNARLTKLLGAGSYCN